MHISALRKKLRAALGYDPIRNRIGEGYEIGGEEMCIRDSSPTDAELSDGANWALVHSGEATESQRSYINHKVIPIARIKSRG